MAWSFNYILTYTEDAERKLVAVTTDGFEITVMDFGSSDYAVQVRNIATGVRQDNDQALLNVAEAVGPQPYGSGVFGEALTWAEPATVVHIVMDLINGQ